jgi:hypothetical protein
MALQTSPIQRSDLAEVGHFLYQNMGRRIAPELWVQSLSQSWASSQPNHGMQLREDGRLVGVICAIYSDQRIGDRVERFCNPHSWCVLEPYRSSSLQLVLGLVRQRGYHFTMYTPNPKVAEVFLGLRFRALDDRLLYLPNLPAPWAGRGGRFVESRPEHMAGRLRGAALEEYESHRHFPWLSFVAFGDPDDACLAIYKRSRWKRLPCALLIHLSDPSALERHPGLLGHHLLGRGMPVTRVEARFLAQVPRLAYRTRRGQPKLVSSPSLRDGEARDVFSELVALDL